MCAHMGATAHSNGFCLIKFRENVNFYQNKAYVASYRYSLVHAVLIILEQMLNVSIGNSPSQTGQQVVTLYSYITKLRT